jgi:hypothetical protein
MMATPAQYAAAAKAIHAHAETMIASLGMFEQAMARQALNDQVVNSFAKAAVDAALSVPEVTSVKT